MVCFQWATESEINNSHFEIERTKNGIFNSVLATIKSKAPNGNNNTKLNYTATYTEASDGLFYYRLKQVDRDGSFTYSNIEALNSASFSGSSVCINPNPNNGNFALSLKNVPKYSQTNIEIKNTLGEPVYNKSYWLDSESSDLFLSPENLPRGIYFCFVTINDWVSLEKLVVN